MTELVEKFHNDVSKGFEKRLSKSIDPYIALFSSMLSSAELYLSDNVVSKAKSSLARARSKSGKLLKRTRNNLVKFLSNPDDGIERLLENTSQQDLNKSLETAGNSRDKTRDVLKYFARSKNSSFVKKALTSLYANFVNLHDYAKKAYETAEDSTKKIVGNVKMTAPKLIKIWEYIMTRLSPQWNRPHGTSADFDYFMPELTLQDSIDSENAKYETGYSFLKYRN